MLGNFSYKQWLIVVAGCSILLRLTFAWHQPFTNDEGAYLYDAQALTRGVLPGGDVLTKSPVVAGLFAVGVWITGGSLGAARSINLLFSLAAAVPLSYLSQKLWDKRTAQWISAVWLLAAGPATWYVLGHTQAMAVFFTLMALAWWSWALGQEAAKRTRQLHFLLCGVVFALAFLSRKTAVAVLPVMLVWVWWDKRSYMWEAVRMFVLGFLLLLVPWVGVIGYIYGPIGVGQLLGAGYENVILSHVLRQGPAISWGAAWNWPVTVLFTAAFPLAVAALVGFGVLLGRFYNTTALPASRRKSMNLAEALLLVWSMTYLLLFLFWPTFLPEYWADFWPLFCLLAVYGVVVAWQYQPKAAAAVVVMLVGLNIVSLVHTWRQPWTGMFTLSSIHAATDFMKSSLPADEPVFTAAVIIPYVSGHHVWREVSHPLWYHFSFIDEPVRHTFLPPLALLQEDIEQGRVTWVLDEQLTDYAYFFAGSPLKKPINEEWVMRHDIKNKTGFRNNTLYFYERVLGQNP